MLWLSYPTGEGEMMVLKFNVRSSVEVAAGYIK